MAHFRSRRSRANLSLPASRLSRRSRANPSPVVAPLSRRSRANSFLPVVSVRSTANYFPRARSNFFHWVNIFFPKGNRYLGGVLFVPTCWGLSASTTWVFFVPTSWVFFVPTSWVFFVPTGGCHFWDGVYHFIGDDQMVTGRRWKSGNPVVSEVPLRDELPQKTINLFFSSPPKQSASYRPRHWKWIVWKVPELFVHVDPRTDSEPQHLGSMADFAVALNR